MPQLLDNVESIIQVFDKFAKEDGDHTALSKGELKQLIQKEFAEVILDPHDSETIETVLQLLDKDTDGKVDFEEFTVLVFKVARACYKEVQRSRDRAAEEQSDKGGSPTKHQDGQPDLPSQSTTTPEDASEDAKSERTSPGQEEDPKSQLQEELSLTDSTPRENKEQEAGKQQASREEKNVEQDHAQTFHQDPQTTTEEARGQDISPTTESQQKTIHSGYQTEEENQDGQQEVKSKGSEQERTTQPHDGQQTANQNEAGKTQRGEQDPKPEVALEEDQESNCQGAQESQTSEGTLTCQIIQDPQTASLEDNPLTSEQSSTYQQDELSQAEEVPTDLQEPKLQKQEQDTNHEAVEEPVGKSSRGTTKEAQESELLQQDREDHKSLPPEQQPATQEEHQGHESEWTSMAPEGDRSNKPKENPADQGPRNSSAQQPFRTSWSHQHSKS
ncbi:hypothetical protein JRQ81_009263 [Phrynocephalus forsythii]|uniref:EF-hand domain-containing protein n=1 Tax=Phrynocephalus forsythii TaxID=171643 RepID=A0A9Q1AS42_9SAUR|nr:hypothetical protein JRQ81_009263 [Phrynocephalus forsythii]